MPPAPEGEEGEMPPAPEGEEGEEELEIDVEKKPKEKKVSDLKRTLLNIIYFWDCLTQHKLVTEELLIGTIVHQRQQIILVILTIPVIR